jgi:hypothetical protein
LWLKKMAEEQINVDFKGKTLPKTFMLSSVRVTEETERKRPKDAKKLLRVLP